MTWWKWISARENWKVAPSGRYIHPVAEDNRLFLQQIHKKK